MGRTIKINRIIKDTIRLVSLCLFISIWDACNDPIDDYPPQDPALIRLNIRMPSSTIVKNTRSGQTALEAAISELKVLVFTDIGGTGEFRYQYMVDAYQIEGGQDLTSTCQLRIVSSTVPIKLYVLANYGDAFTTFSPTVGMSEISVKKGVSVTFTDNGLNQDLPMFGEVSLRNLDASATTELYVTLLRSIARVDVKTELISGTPDLTLRHVYIYRTENRIQVIPDSLAADGTIKVTVPSVPAEASVLTEPVIKSSATPTDSIGGLYIPESVGSDPNQQPSLATTIVVGGIFSNDTAVSYYRIDFNSGHAGHPFGQILRNYLYLFSIKKVEATGWATPEEALANPGSSLTVEVRQWEDFTTGMYFHDNYIGISTRQVDMPFLPYYTRTIDIESSINYEMEWLSAPDSGKVSGVGDKLSDGYFTATIEREDGESVYLSHITIESPQYNRSDDTLQRILRLSGGGTSVDITVVKESPSLYASKTINVLSVGANTYGNLGSFDLPAIGYTQAMRYVLDYNFLPTSIYPFKTGGFFFTSTSSAALYNAVSAADVAHFKRILNSVDVLIMAYEINPSVPVANMLLEEWLKEYPHRVLWVMRDDNITNTNILNITAAEGEGTWQNIGAAYDASAGFRLAGPEDYEFNNRKDVLEFYNGPFGSVDTLGVYVPGDGVSGACKLDSLAKQFVTPLVYSNKTNYKDYMSLGINKKRGIIYQGEAQFFMVNTGMSVSANTNGTLTTTPLNGKYFYDVLNANIWAWVTGRVIYGPAP